MDSSESESSRPDRDEIWKHCVDEILALDSHGVKALKKGGIKRLNHIFQYCTNVENFDNRY